MKIDYDYEHEHDSLNTIQPFIGEITVAEITASMVKELRDKTGAGMMDCKKALGETGGEFEAAVDWLRKRGQAIANKRGGRAMKEGPDRPQGRGQRRGADRVQRRNRLRHP